MFKNLAFNRGSSPDFVYLQDS